jgi:hypothetical protein
MNLHRRPLKTLAEATTTSTLHLGDSANADDYMGDSSDLSPQRVDPVRAYERFRQKCPRFHELSHAAGCERCDSFPRETGGVTYKLRNDPRARQADVISPAWPAP